MKTTKKKREAQEFARRLNAAMLERGWNQSDLARAASRYLGDGKTFYRDNVSKYLRGITSPSPKYLSALASALNVAPEDLWPGFNLAPPGPEHTDFSLTDYEDGMAWLKIDQPVPWDVAVKIARILKGGAEE